MDTKTQNLFSTNPATVKHSHAAAKGTSNKPAFALTQNNPVIQKRERIVAPQMISSQDQMSMSNMQVASAENVPVMPTNFKMSHPKQTAASSSRVTAPKMQMSSNSQASSWGSQKLQFSEMSSKAKMRVKPSQVTMSAMKNDNKEFTISRSNQGAMNMNANHMDEQIGGSNKLKNVSQLVGATAVALALFSANPAYAADLNNGKQIFEGNCAACHAGGQNVIQAEKTLEKDALVEYLEGGFNEKSIIYQVKNGKNSMPAWSGRLSEDEINNVSAYVYDQANGAKWAA